MNNIFVISTTSIDQDGIKDIIKSGKRLFLDPDLKILIEKKRADLIRILEISTKPVYGINTGFGALCNTIIPDNQLNELQNNLVRSHACGFGELASPELCRLVLFLKIFSLCKGYSAVRIELVEYLINLYNSNVFPVIPQMGSLGASGDLAPLAHLSLACIGEGKVYYNNKINETAAVLEQCKIEFPSLKAKEGLALLNGTQFSLALLIEAFWMANNCYHNSNMIAVLSMESFNCNISFLHPVIHKIRNQNGQIDAANNMLQWLEGSDIMTRDNKSIQDPYSFRCAPQVHGACNDLIVHCENIINNEINSVTDNPLLVTDDEIISGGNFHAQPIAFASDILSLSLCELGGISERRLYQLVCGLRGLPDFLTVDPGLNSGYMILQYAAAAAVSMNKQFATPSSIDSIISSKGQEDHVSMATNAGIKCNIIAKQTETVLAMEWMAATRAWQFRTNWILNDKLETIYKAYRSEISYQEKDHIPSTDYEPTILFLRNQLHFA
jgi:histidine ammonia-lyase